MLGVLAATSSAITSTAPEESTIERQEPTVAVGDDSLLWPYTSRATAFEKRTLPINVVVGGDPAETRRHLEERSPGNWNETAPDQEDLRDTSGRDADDATTAWSRADGSTRYVYVAPADDPAAGRWLDESYQLHDGTYLGSRHHVRAYESPTDGDEWTAMQAHSEHWDWFRLSHTVDSVETSQRYVEREFMDRRDGANVTRVHLGNDRGSDANGWVTIVDLEGGPPLALSIAGLLPGVALAIRATSRASSRAFFAARTPRALLLAGSLIVVYHVVRFGGIVAETGLAGVDLRIVAGALYLLLAVGLPVCAYHFARSLDRPTAFAASSVGFAISVLLDYTFLGVTRLPVNVFVHRFSTAIALGFIAVGASHTVRVDPEDHDYVRLGALLWVVTLLVPLLRFLP